MIPRRLSVNAHVTTPEAQKIAGAVIGKAVDELNRLGVTVTFTSETEQPSDDPDQLYPKERS